MGFFRKLNLPNKLTVLRMIGVLIIICLGIFDFYFDVSVIEININYSKITFSWIRCVLLFLFIACTLTDYFDGHIARSRNQVTTFGKFLDPIADKLLNNIIVIFLACKGDLSFIVPIVFIFRDTFVDGIRMIASQKNIVLAASKLGKAKTVIQVVLICSTFVLAPFAAISMACKIIIIVLSVISCLASIISGVDYTIKNKQLFSEVN